MRVLKFDKVERDALRSIGFRIADDDETAEADLRVTFVRPAPEPGERGGGEFLLQIDLPNGETLTRRTSRTEILAAAGEDVEDAEE